MIFKLVEWNCALMVAFWLRNETSGLFVTWLGYFVKKWLFICPARRRSKSSEVARLSVTTLLTSSPRLKPCIEPIPMRFFQAILPRIDTTDELI